MVLLPGCKCCGGGGGWACYEPVAAPFRCYTDGVNHQCFGDNEPHPAGWTTDGVEHTTLADCQAACGSGGGCSCTDSASAVVTVHNAVRRTSGGNATDAQAAAGLALINGFSYTLAGGYNSTSGRFELIHSIPACVNWFNADITCEKRPAQDVGGGSPVIQGPDNLFLNCRLGDISGPPCGPIGFTSGSVSFSPLLFVRQYYTTAEWDQFCSAANGFVPPPSPIKWSFEIFGQSGEHELTGWVPCKGSQQFTIKNSYPATFYGWYESFTFNFDWELTIEITSTPNPLP